MNSDLDMWHAGDSRHWPSSKVRIACQSSRSHQESKYSATAEMSDASWKEEMNWKLRISTRNSQPKIHGRRKSCRVVVATSREGFLVCQSTQADHNIGCYMKN